MIFFRTTVVPSYHPFIWFWPHDIRPNGITFLSWRGLYPTLVRHCAGQGAVKILAIRKTATTSWAPRRNSSSQVATLKIVGASAICTRLFRTGAISIIKCLVCDRRTWINVHTHWLTHTCVLANTKYNVKFASRRLTRHILYRISSRGEWLIRSQYMYRAGNQKMCATSVAKPGALTEFPNVFSSTVLVRPEWFWSRQSETHDERMFSRLASRNYSNMSRPNKGSSRAFHNLDYCSGQLKTNLESDETEIFNWI